MNHLDLLRSDIQAVELTITSQETACNVAREMLEHRRAAYSVAKSAAAANGTVLSVADNERYRQDILEGHDVLHAKLTALGEMRRELRGLEH